MHLSRYAGRVYRNFATLIPSQELMDDLTENAAHRETLKALYYRESAHMLPSPIERVLQKSEAQIIQEEIDSKFHPESWQRSRYSDGTWAVLYTAESEETALREALHHMMFFYSEELKAKPIEAQRRVLTLQVGTDRCRDFSEEGQLSQTHLLSKDDSGYPYCQKLALQSRRDGAEMLRAPSARHAGGFCTPIFVKKIVAKDEGHLKYLRCLLHADGSAHVTGLIEEATRTIKT